MATLPLKQFVAQAERKEIERVLRIHNGNRTHTAKALSISRRTLLNKIDQYGLGKVAEYAEPASTSDAAPEVEALINDAADADADYTEDDAEESYDQA